jgi:hypothetical protein
MRDMLVLHSGRQPCRCKMGSAPCPVALTWSTYRPSYSRMLREYDSITANRSSRGRQCEFSLTAKHGVHGKDEIVVFIEGDALVFTVVSGENVSHLTERVLHVLYSKEMRINVGQIVQEGQNQQYVGVIIVLLQYIQGDAVQPTRSVQKLGLASEASEMVQQCHVEEYHGRNSGVTRFIVAIRAGIHQECSIVQRQEGLVLGYLDLGYARVEIQCDARGGGRWFFQLATMVQSVGRVVIHVFNVRCGRSAAGELISQVGKGQLKELHGLLRSPRLGIGDGTVVDLYRWYISGQSLHGLLDILGVMFACWGIAKVRLIKVLDFDQ